VLKNKPIGSFSLAVGLLIVSTPLFGHHGTNASYQGDKTATLSGTVTEWDFAYPHPAVYFDVKDDSGKVVHWAAEIAPTPVMMKALHVGWNKDSIKPGDQITVTYHPSKVATSSVGLAMKLVVNGKEIPLTNAQNQPATQQQP
jgi:hypothetical protein